MSMFFIQELGNSKGLIVELVHQKQTDVILRCVKDDFVFAVSKDNFKKFYSDFDVHEDYQFNPSEEELNNLEVADLSKL